MIIDTDKLPKWAWLAAAGLWLLMLGNGIGLLLAYTEPGFLSINLFVISLVALIVGAAALLTRADL